MLTQARLKKLLHYDPVTGIFTWLVSNSNRVKIGDVAGSLQHGYVNIVVDGDHYKAHRLTWLFIHGYFPENSLDHKDRIRHHNWIDNLREATKVCNARNTGNYCTNTSGVKGVFWHKEKGKWASQISVNGKHIFLGRYTTKLEASCHRLAAEQAEDWVGCDSSSPAYQYVQKHILVSPRLGENY